MRTWILLICFLLAPAHAGAEGIDATEVSSEARVVERGAECFERALEARVGEILAERAAVAEGRAIALLERRAAGRLGEASRAAARRAEPLRATALVRSARRGPLEGELAVLRIGFLHLVERSH